MASFLEAVQILETTGLLKVVLPAIFIMVLLFAILEKYGVFGQDKKLIHALTAIVVGMIMLSFSKALMFVTFLIPFFVAAFVGLFLILILFMFMGVSGETIAEKAKHPAVFMVFIAIIVLSVISAINFAFPEYSAFAVGGTIDAPIENVTPAQRIQLESARIMFDPTIIGMIIMFVVFAATAFAITMPDSIGKK